MEKEFDDHVYEDDYYDEHYEEEELEGEDKELFDENDDSDDEDLEEEKIHVSFACEDCDYRWDDVILKKKGNLEDEIDEFDVVCPMCGSVSVTQI